MKIIGGLLLVVLFICSNGCLSNSDPESAKRTISHWVPIGTPAADAIHIMKGHGFECTQDGENSITCSRTTKIMMNFCVVSFVLKDGKVAAINPPTIGNGLMNSN